MKRRLSFLILVALCFILPARGLAGRQVNLNLIALSPINSQEHVGVLVDFDRIALDPEAGSVVAAYLVWDTALADGVDITFMVYEPLDAWRGMDVSSWAPAVSDAEVSVWVFTPLDQERPEPGLVRLDVTKVVAQWVEQERGYGFYVVCPEMTVKFLAETLSACRLEVIQAHLPKPLGP